MDVSKIFHGTLLILFIVFISIYLSSTSGYYEYENKKQTKLTEEKMQEFEKDLEEGKNVSLKDYLSDETVNYDNKITNFGSKLSDFVCNGIIKGLEKSFKVVEKLIE
jgi:hypothetical protein